MALIDTKCGPAKWKWEAMSVEVSLVGLRLERVSDEVMQVDDVLVKIWGARLTEYGSIIDTTQQ